METQTKTTKERKTIMTGTMKPEIDLSYVPEFQTLQLSAVIPQLEKLLKRLKQAANAENMKRIDPRQPLVVQIGDYKATIQHVPQGEGKYVVKDERAFGRELQNARMEKYYVLVPMPTEDAMKPDFLKPLIEKDFDGTIPEGVEWKNGVSEQLRVTPDRSCRDMYVSLNEIPAMLPLLDTGTYQPETEKGDWDE